MTLFAILTLFPEAVEAYVRSSILGLAQEKGKVRIQLTDIRDFTRDKHRTVDDRPFGGGPGMVMKPEPIVECVEWLEREHGTFHKIALCPAGTPFRQTHAEALVAQERILLLCGRYEGFDARILSQLDFHEYSVGDFVLAGGELPALAITEAVSRLVPGVLGDERSALLDSFQVGGGLDHPHFTRPRVFRGEAVPEILLSGDHQKIDRWRQAEALKKTRARRPDLLQHENSLENPLKSQPHGAQPPPHTPTPKPHNDVSDRTRRT
ncbi:MAG: tRNA (guanosine(37)-N1)-methyltransferase TrmD [Planctomycetes bacterium]|nr:tRNA (guanosine(37)-N1)-methyltransferase TrmD [Planctomycetota bacterium]